MASAGDRRTGRVVSYDATRGLGWIVDIDDEDTESAQPTSVHYSEIRPAWPDDKLTSRSSLLQGEYVEYSVGPNPKNPSRTCCKDVTGIDQGPLMMDHAVVKRVIRRSRDFDARVAHQADVPGSRRGRVVSYHARKGWGFIKDLDSDDAFFVHFSEILYYWRLRLGADEPDRDGHDYKPCLFTGEYVQFEVGSNPVTNQTCAKRVTGPRCGPLLMDFGTYRYVRYRRGTSTAPATDSAQQHEETAYSGGDSTSGYYGYAPGGNQNGGDDQDAAGTTSPGTSTADWTTAQ